MPLLGSLIGGGANTDFFSTTGTTGGLTSSTFLDPSDHFYSFLYSLGLSSLGLSTGTSSLFGSSFFSLILVPMPHLPASCLFGASSLSTPSKLSKIFLFLCPRPIDGAEGADGVVLYVLLLPKLRTGAEDSTGLFLGLKLHMASGSISALSVYLSLSCRSFICCIKIYILYFPREVLLPWQ